MEKYYFLKIYYDLITKYSKPIKNRSRKEL